MEIEFVIDKKKSSTGKVRVEARDGNRLLHVETLNLGNAKSRRRFAKAVAEVAGDATISESVEARLLDSLNEGERDGDTSGPLDAYRIVRPDLFITPEVLGMTVPDIVLREGKPQGKWQLYLQWQDGRRERRDIVESITLPGGSALYLHPLPGAPSPTEPPRWSISARRQWLKGPQRSGTAADVVSFFNDLRAAFDDYIELPAARREGTVATLALWTLLTYVYPAWPAVPYLYVGGPLGSGKTRVFEVLKELVYRPLPASSVTAPVLFRTLHDRGGTLLLDEAEQLKESTPDANAIRTILLAGYKHGNTARRLEGADGEYRSVEFEVYGPKALASIAGVPAALASRCINIAMFRAAPGSSKTRRRLQADADRWADLRDRLHVLALGTIGRKPPRVPGRDDSSPPKHPDQLQHRPGIDRFRG